MRVFGFLRFCFSFITRPSFTMSSSSSAAAVTATAAAAASTHEKKKTCCPFSDCRYRMKASDSVIVCRCGISFCPSHRLPEQHSCSFNYRAAATQHLSTQLVKCAGDRLVDKL
jgi:hypothetical protein